MSRHALIVIAVLLVSACQTTKLPEGSLIPLPGDTIADGSTERTALNAKVYDRVVRRVKTRFYDRNFNGVDFQTEAAARRAAVINQPTEATFYRSLNELLDLLDDDHTYAARPHRVIYRTVSVPSSASFGFWTVPDVQARDGERRFYVNHVRPDGPAAGLGIQRGWWVQSIDDQPSFGSFQPTEGQEYVFRFVDRNGQVHPRTIRYLGQPDELGVMVRRPDGVAVITIRGFRRETGPWLEARLAELQADPPKAVVIDLRFSPGGDAEVTPNLLGGFFSERARFGRYLLSSTDRIVAAVLGVSTPEHLRPSPRAWIGPMAVLQSATSASAAEIFAATVQECRRGPIVGETSDGAVVLAYIWALPDGGKMAVGVSEFVTGGGVRLEKTGVTPDVEFVRTSESLQTEDDEMLNVAARAALAAPAGGRCNRSSDRAV